MLMVFLVAGLWTEKNK